MKFRRSGTLSVESDSQPSQHNQTQVLPATLKQKAASSEQMKKANVSSLCACVLSDCTIVFLTLCRTPRLHVKTSISLPWVGEVPDLFGVPPGGFYVNRPLVISTLADISAPKPSQEC